MIEKTNPWCDVREGDVLVRYWTPPIEHQHCKVLKVLKDETGTVPMVEVEFPNRSTGVLPLSDFDHGEREA